MSIGIPHNISKDWRVLLAESDSATRKIQLRNMAREEAEGKVKWKNAQMNLYGNLEDITPDTSLGQIISSETSLATNQANNREQAIQDLRTIADDNTAEYIVDRLTPDEIVSLLVNFNGIVRDLKKRYSRMEKDIFVNYVKNMTAQRGTINTTPQPLSELGESRQQQRIAEGLAQEEIVREQDLKTQEEFEARNRKAERDRVRNERRQAREQVPDVENIGGLFGGAEQEIADSIEEQRLRAMARERQGNQDLLKALSANDSATTKLGPTTPNPSKGPTISPDEGRGGGGRKISKKEREERDKLLEEGLANSPFKGSPVKTAKGRSKKPNEEVQGRGVIYGRGTTMRPLTAKKRFYFGRYYIELDKLATNILSAKYSRTDAHLPTLKVQHISNKVKELIQDVMKETYDERLFKILSEDDKRVFKRFVKALHLDNIPIQDDLDEQFQKEYEILLGEFNSGNNAPEVKKALKRYVVEGLNEGKLNRNQAYFLLYQLSL